MKFDNKKFKIYRQSKGFTMSELAKKLNVNKSTVSVWESGQKTPRINQIFKIAKVLNIKASDFTDLEDTSTHEQLIKSAPSTVQAILEKTLKLDKEHQEFVLKMIENLPNEPTHEK